MHGIYSSQEAKILTNEEIGIKAKKLTVLQLLGFYVPNWFVISAEACQNIDRQAVIDEIEKTIFTTFQSNTKYIIRFSQNLSASSIPSTHDFIESRINIERKNVYNTIRSTINYARASKVNTYTREHKPVYDINTAIIIQEFIETDIAGAAYDYNILADIPEEQIIYSNYGIQHGINIGSKNHDTFTINKKQINSNLHTKASKIVSENSKLSNIELTDKEKKEPSLSTLEIKQICNSLHTLRDHFGKAERIEFGFKNNEFFIFDTEPIKTKLKNNKIEWERQGVEESFPQNSLPLTYSFASMVYETSYKNMLQSLGISLKSIDKSLFFNILGHIKGGIYLNVNKKKEYYKLFPAFFFKHFFEENSANYFKGHEKNLYKRSKRFFQSGLSFIDSFRKLPLQMKAFANNFDKTMYEFHKTPLQNLESFELYNLFIQCKSNILNKWHIPLINNLFANFFLSKIETFITRQEKKNIHISLCDTLKSCGGKISSEPFSIISDIIEMINENQSLQILFNRNNSEEIYSYILKYPQSNISLKIFYYIHNFGNKVPYELNLEHVTIRQNPVKLIDTIKYVLTNSISQQKISQKKETEKDYTIELGYFAKIYFNILKSRLKIFIKNKELARLYKTRVFGFIREIFIALGKKFVEENILNEYNDIFYFSIHEIFNYIHGKSSVYNLSMEVEVRKKEYNLLKNKTLPFKLTTYGTSNSYDFKIKKNIFNNVLGEGCSSGNIMGQAINIKDIHAISEYRNPILIADIIDPGHVDLLLTVRGIVLEYGNQLSHISIIARTLNIPCIINAKGACNAFKTGDFIEINGENGNIIHQKKSQKLSW